MPLSVQALHLNDGSARWFRDAVDHDVRLDVDFALRYDAGCACVVYIDSGARPRAVVKASVQAQYARNHLSV